MDIDLVFKIVVLIVVFLLVFKSALDTYTIGKLVSKVKELGEKIK